MPGITRNLRDATFTTGSGKDVSKTGQLSNGARTTSAEKSKNVTKEYKSKAMKMGTLGGKASHS